MSLRTRIFIIISVIVLIILSISIFLVVKNKQQGNSNEPGNISGGIDTAINPTTGMPNDIGASAPAGLPVKPLSSLEIEKNNVEQLAKIFVERYGTYSTDNEFENIKEVKSLVTQALWSQISAVMNIKNTSQNFLGITTKVISVSISNWSADKVSLTLNAMRTEDKNGATTTRYQNVVVEMIKAGGVWLASSIVWQ